MALLLDEASHPEEERIIPLLSKRLLSGNWNTTTANMFNSIPYKEWLLLLPLKTPAGAQTLLHLAIQTKNWRAVEDMIDAVLQLPEEIYKKHMN